MELIKNKKETGCEEEQGSDDCLGAVLCYCSAHGTDKINLHSSLTKTYAGHTHLTVQHRAGFCIRVLSVFTPDEIFLVPPNLLCTPSDKKPPIHIQWYAMLLLTTLWSRHAITTNIWSNSIWWEEAFPTMSECCPSQINKECLLQWGLITYPGTRTFSTPSFPSVLPEQHLQVCSILRRAAALATIVENFHGSRIAESRWDPFHFHRAEIKDLFPLFLLAQCKIFYRLDPRKWYKYILVCSVGFLDFSSSTGNAVPRTTWDRREWQWSLSFRWPNLF